MTTASSTSSRAPAASQSCLNPIVSYKLPAESGGRAGDPASPDVASALGTPQQGLKGRGAGVGVRRRVSEGLTQVCVPPHTTQTWHACI